MENKIKEDAVEESVLIISILKWSILSIITGFSVGTVISLFNRFVYWGISYTYKFKYFFLLMPIAFFISAFIVKEIAPQASGHGTEKAIESVVKNNGNMSLSVVPVKLITAFITILSGGSVGLEGPATQVGAAISSFLGNRLKMLNIDKKRIVVCGISAGFVSVFGAPVGAAIFACEVLFVGKISYISLFPSLIASFVSYYWGLFLGNSPLKYSVNYIPKNQFRAFITIFAFGILVGVAALLFIKLMNLIGHAFKIINIYPPLKGIIGGAVMILLIYITGTTTYLGIGDKIIDRVVNGHSINGLEFVMKSLATSITLGAGGSGGTLTPMLFIGSTFGSTFGELIHSNLAFYSAIGMVAFLGSCSNVPISAIVISMELFGHNVGIYASIAIGVAYLIVGHESIYPTQYLVTSKTPSIDIDLNCELKEIDTKKPSRKFKLMIRKFIHKK